MLCRIGEHLGIGVLAISTGLSPERVGRAAAVEGATGARADSGIAKRSAIQTVAVSSAWKIQRCQMLWDRKMVVAAPIRQASPQVPKLSIHAMI